MQSAALRRMTPRGNAFCCAVMPEINMREIL